MIFQLTNGGKGHRSTVSYYETREGAQAVAQAVFETYEPYRNDPDTEDLRESIEWAVTAEKFFKDITFDPTLKGFYATESYFEITEHELGA